MSEQDQDREKAAPGTEEEVEGHGWREPEQEKFAKEESDDVEGHGWKGP
jgi:hypothetical protein